MEAEAVAFRIKRQNPPETYRILLIEDSASDVALIRELLAHDPIGSSFAVSDARTLAEGIRLAASAKFDVVMLDLNLPDTVGYATFEAAQSAIQQVPIVILTSVGGEDIATESVSNGAQDFVFKDRIDSFWLAQAIRRAFSRHQLVERVLQAEKREIEAANRASQAKSDFLAAMSHDIRTPIGAIIMTSEILQQAEIDPWERISLGALLQRNGQHLLELVNGVLDLSRVEAGCVTIAPVAVQLNDLLTELQKTFEPVARKKSLALDLEIDASVPQAIKCDPTRLRQIVSNLMSNAIKFTKTGRVVLRATASTISGNPRAIIQVEDTGEGIPPDKLDLLFQRYSQADARIERLHGGSGLGLMLSRKLAEALGGTLTLKESHVDRGSTFELSLPVEELTNPHPASTAERLKEKIERSSSEHAFRQCDLD